jgi:hypothetical protein
MPSVRPDQGVNNAGSGYTALVGGTLFELGALMAVWESINESSVVFVPFAGIDVGVV